MFSFVNNFIINLLLSDGDSTCTSMLFSVLSVCSLPSSTSSGRFSLSGSVMKLGFSCRIHFLYTLITFLVAEASQDGNRNAWRAVTLNRPTVIDH